MPFPWGHQAILLVLQKEQNSYEVVILTSHKGSFRISVMVGRGDRKNKREKEENTFRARSIERRRRWLEGFSVFADNFLEPFGSDRT